MLEPAQPVDDATVHRWIHHQALELVSFGQIQPEDALDLVIAPSVTMLEAAREALAGIVPWANRGNGGKLRTRCVNGHLYTADNTRLRKDGFRRCRECERGYDHKRRS